MSIYISPFIIDRIGADRVFGHRFTLRDWIEFREFLMEQLCAEHWFYGIDH